MRDYFSRHSKVALMFSGGRDSIACLMLCKEFWSQLDVVWVNPGSPYPEMVEQMAKVRAMVPHFIEVTGQQPDFIRDNGYPVDVLPLSMTPFGRLTGRSAGVRVASYFQCCSENLWQPAVEHIKKSGYTGVIRGDKYSDDLKPPLTSGDVQDGVEFLFPLEHLSDDKVLEIVGDKLPPSYQRGIRTSLDCINCTAYLSHNLERIAELKTLHPSVHEEVQTVLRTVDAEIHKSSAFIQQSGVLS